MKLICTAGPFANKSYDVYPPGISIGREDDNDVVLHDEEMSRYHAKIEYHDSTWYIHDMNSSNGVVLNGKKIRQSAPLAIQDELRIGASTFRFADESGQLSMGAGATREPAQMATVSDATGDRGKLLRLGLVALLALLVVLVIAVLLQTPGAAPALPMVEPLELAAAHPLEVYYENVSVDGKTVFRYEMQLKGETLSVAIDDVINNTTVREALELTGDQAAAIRRELLTTEWLQASPVRARAQRAGVIERRRLLVRAGPVGNYLVIQGTAAPTVLESAVSYLTNLVQQELGVFLEPIPRELVISRAETFYLTAVRLHQESVVEASNLYRAILGYRQVLQRLKWVDDKPSWYEEAVQRKESAEAELQEIIDDLRKEAVTFRHTGQYPLATARLRKIIEMIDDPRHAEVIRARNDILSIDRQQRN